MFLFLFAEQQFSRGWWFDFVDQWGNSASVTGLVITLVAFIITWIIQFRIKQAIRVALRKAEFDVLATTVEDLHRQLTTAREAGRLKMWLRAFDYCHHARTGILRLAGNSHLTDEEKISLWASADDLAQVIRYIEGNKLGPNPSPVFQQDKRDILDAMVTLLANIQSRLRNKTWEV